MIVNLDDGKLQKVDFPLSHSRSPFAAITSQEGHDFVFVAEYDGTSVNVYNGYPLNWIAECSIQNILGANARVESLVAQGDKVMVSGNKDKHLILWFEGDALRTGLLKCERHHSTVGNRMTVALVDPMRSLRSSDHVVIFGEIELRGGVFSLHEHLVYSADKDRREKETAKIFDRGNMSLVPIVQTRLYAVLFDKDPRALTIVNCNKTAAGYIDYELPIPCKSNFQMTRDGFITFSTDDDPFVVLIYRPLVNIKQYNPAFMAAIAQFLPADPGSIVASYCQDEIEVPTLQKFQVEQAMQWAGLTFEDDKVKVHGPTLFSSADSCSPDLSDIKKMLEAPDDAECYRLAFNFIKENPDNLFAKELEDSMGLPEGLFKHLVFQKINRGNGI